MSDDHLLSVLRTCGICIFHSPALAPARLWTFVEISWVIYNVSPFLRFLCNNVCILALCWKWEQVTLSLVICLKSHRLHVIDVNSGVLIPQWLLPFASQWVLVFLRHRILLTFCTWSGCWGEACHNGKSKTPNFFFLFYKKSLERLHDTFGMTDAVWRSHLRLAHLKQCQRGCPCICCLLCISSHLEKDQWHGF